MKRAAAAGSESSEGTRTVRSMPNLMPDDFLEVLENSMGPLPKKTLAPRACARCKIAKQILLVMEPGADGEAWWLCVPCWKLGAR